MSTLKIHNKIHLAEISCFFIFVILCFYHYFSQRPLWLDEVSIFNNIQKLGYGGIFGPLEHAQAFPRVYLCIIKYFSSHFHYSVLSLRFFPLVCMICAYGVWMRIFRRVFEKDTSYLLCLFTWVSSYYFSYYGGEFKPYSMDVLVVGLFAWFILNQERWKTEQPQIRDYIIVFSLAASLFLSYASFFVFWIIPFNFLFFVRQNKSLWLLIISYTIFAGFSLLLIYYVDLRHSWNNGPLMSYWDSYFLCRDSPGCFMESFWEGVRRLSTYWFGKDKIFVQSASFLIPVFLYSLVKNGFRVWFQQRGRIVRMGAFMAVLFVQLAILGISKKYPFTGERVTLFMGPAILYTIIKGIEDTQRIRFLFYPLIIAYGLLLTASFINTVIIYLQFYSG